MTEVSLDITEITGKVVLPKQRFISEKLMQLENALKSPFEALYQMTCETCFVLTKGVHCAWNFVTKLNQ